MAIPPLVPDRPPAPAPTLPTPVQPLIPMPPVLTERQELRIQHAFTFAGQRVST